MIRKNFLLFLIFFIWIISDIFDYQYRGVSQIIRTAIILTAVFILPRKITLSISSFLIISILCLLSFALNYPNGNYIFSVRLWVLVNSTIIFFNIFSSLKNSDILNFLTLSSFLISLQVILALFMGIEVYDASSSFGGSKGFMTSTNQLSYLILILLSSNLMIISVRLLRNHKLNRMGMINLFVVILLFFTAFLVTTKVVMFGAIIIVMIFIYSFSKRISVAFAMLLGFSFFITDYSELLITLSQNFSSIYRITFEMSYSDDILNIISSGRWERIQEYAIELMNSSWLIPSRDKFVNFESDLFDVIYNFGFFGLGVFIIFSIRLFMFLNCKNNVFRITLLIIILASILSGHFLSAILLSPFLALFGLIATKNRDILRHK